MCYSVCTYKLFGFHEAFCAETQRNVQLLCVCGVTLYRVKVVSETKVHTDWIIKCPKMTPYTRNMQIQHNVYRKACVCLLKTRNNEMKTEKMWNNLHNCLPTVTNTLDIDYY